MTFFHKNLSKINQCSCHIYVYRERKKYYFGFNEHIYGFHRKICRILVSFLFFVLLSLTSVLFRCTHIRTYAHSHKRTKWRVIILIGYWYDLASSFTDDKLRSKWLSQTCFSSVIASNLHCIYIVNNGLNGRKKSSAGFCFVIFLTFSKISTLILSYDYMVYDATVNSNFFEWSAVVVVRI